MSKDANFLMYMPSHISESRLPSADYFYAILNTLYPELMNSMIEHANKVRNLKTEEEAKEETILISKEWMDEL